MTATSVRCMGRERIVGHCRVAQGLCKSTTILSLAGLRKNNHHHHLIIIKFAMLFLVCILVCDVVLSVHVPSLAVGHTQILSSP